MRMKLIWVLVAAVVALGLTGCPQAGNGGSRAQGPGLTGTWAGTISADGENAALEIRVTQDGTTLSGTMSAGEVDDIEFSGSRDGNTIELTAYSPSEDVPIYFWGSVTGDGPGDTASGEWDNQDFYAAEPGGEFSVTKQ